MVIASFVANDLKPSDDLARVAVMKLLPREDILVVLVKFCIGHESSGKESDLYNKGIMYSMILFPSFHLLRLTYLPFIGMREREREIYHSSRSEMWVMIIVDFYADLD